MKIAAITKLKNGVLFQAAEKLGGQSALARHLDLSSQLVGLWCNMKAAPPKEPTKWWTKDRLDVLEKKLFDLTEKTLDEIFPDELRDSEFLQQDKRRVAYADVEVKRLTKSVSDTLMIEDTTELWREREDLRERVAEVLQTLPFREREILKMRFGIPNGHPLTLREVARVFKTTKERIRQIESRAIRHLQDPQRSKHLVGFVD